MWAIVLHNMMKLKEPEESYINSQNFVLAQRTSILWT